MKAKQLHHETICTSRQALVSPNKNLDKNNSFQEVCKLFCNFLQFPITFKSIFSTSFCSGISNGPLMPSSCANTVKGPRINCHFCLFSGKKTLSYYSGDQQIFTDSKCKNHVVSLTLTVIFHKYQKFHPSQE